MARILKLFWVRGQRRPPPKPRLHILMNMHFSHPCPQLKACLVLETAGCMCLALVMAVHALNSTCHITGWLTQQFSMFFLYGLNLF